MFFDEDGDRLEELIDLVQVQRKGPIDLEIPYFLEHFVLSTSEALSEAIQVRGGDLDGPINVSVAYLFVGELLDEFEQFKSFEAIEPKPYVTLDGGKRFTARDVTAIIKSLMKC